MFWKVLGAISLFNLLKPNQNDSNLNYEIEKLIILKEIRKDLN